MNEYTDLGNNLNKIGGVGGGVSLGVEPITIAARRARQNAMQNIAMDNINQETYQHKLMNDFANQQLTEQTQAGPFDFLSIIPGIGNIISGINSKNKAAKNDAIKSLYDRYGGQ